MARRPRLARLLLAGAFAACDLFCPASGISELVEVPQTEPFHAQLGIPGADEEGAERERDMMTELLHWAVKHSDPEKTKELMKKYQEKNLTIKDVYGQDVLDAMFRREEDIMTQQILVIRDFRNSSKPDSLLLDVLEEIEELLHQVDNAGNLHKMGGMQSLLDLSLTEERSEEIRVGALWALGVAVQNNVPVQQELHALGGLTLFAQRLRHCSGRSAGDIDAADEEADGPEFCSKLLFTLSGMVKNSATLQAEADSLGVMIWLMDVGIRHSAMPVAKKAMGLLEDILALSPKAPLLERLPLRREAVAATLLAYVRGEGLQASETDAAEKALVLIQRLLSVRPLLFQGTSFREDFDAASRIAKQRCEQHFGAGVEPCTGLSLLVSQAQRMLIAVEANRAG